MQSSDWLLPSSHLAWDILNVSSQYFCILGRNIDIGNKRVNYLKKFLVTRKIDNKRDPHPHPHPVGGEKVFPLMAQ